jgi:hypothetical protein
MMRHIILCLFVTLAGGACTPTDVVTDASKLSAVGYRLPVSCDEIESTCIDMCGLKVGTLRPCSFANLKGCTDMCSTAKQACLDYRLKALGNCDLSVKCDSFGDDNQSCIGSRDIDSFHAGCKWMKSVCQASSDEENREKRCFICNAEYNKKWNSECGGGVACSLSTDEEDDPCCDAAEEAWRRCMAADRCPQPHHAQFTER